jgi:hypothetical protein
MGRTIDEMLQVAKDHWRELGSFPQIARRETIEVRDPADALLAGYPNAGKLERLVRGKLVRSRCVTECTVAGFRCAKERTKLKTSIEWSAREMPSLLR